VRRVLDVLAQDVEAVDLGRERGGDRRVLRVVPLRDQLRRPRRVGLHHGAQAELAQHAAHLAEGDGVRVRALEALDPRPARREQAVLDALEMLAHHEQAGAGQQMVDVRHAAGERVLAGQHGELGAALAHRLDRRLEGRAGQCRAAGKGGAAGEVGIGARDALEGDPVAHRTGSGDASTRRARSRSAGVSTPNGA
jgi:hypothetical protein